jgi:hypothetical protein
MQSKTVPGCVEQRCCVYSVIRSGTAYLCVEYVPYLHTKSILGVNNACGIYVYTVSIRFDQIFPFFTGKRINHQSQHNPQCVSNDDLSSFFY